MILNEIEKFVFFDGNIYNQNCEAKNDYWLGSGDAEKYLKAHIIFSFEKEEITINIFEHLQNETHKNLFDFEAPKNGFYREDLNSLSEFFQFTVLKDVNGNEVGTYLGHTLELIIKKKNKIFFLIYSINGGRAPESIYFFGLYEAVINEEFAIKYLKK